MVLAAVTTACIPPKYTMLLAGVASKFVPVIVTVVPGLPRVGLTELIVGCPYTQTDTVTMTNKQQRSFFMIWKIFYGDSIQI